MAEPTSRFGTKRLYRDAGSMASSSVANAVLGIGFWAMAAKIFPPAELGVMTAVLAVIVSVGVVIAAGVGDAYAALFPAAGDDRRRFYRIGQRTFLALALVSGVVAAVCTTTTAPSGCTDPSGSASWSPWESWCGPGSRCRTRRWSRSAAQVGCLPRASR